ncbi:hypothetical protein QQX10_04440 [Demequina sp. SYSU T00039]|uniref:PknH-like extracellular domain-containing protein n=1 Tax=Demequina lignilytica TaxID=3051663 RepID=A0AAW7M7Z9_9MICO|nr:MULTISPECIES: hypothetical protein [unclassified Demequina]MDN4477242.1 hypothetical protein [Demequina sp. SYSU T00039-1]MDN4487415.1 hypothetical protein [Demequina sp. SYSU T00039]MDN4491168.1 hypothetical protein [Demequina sp. SYSU T00068]
MIRENHPRARWGRAVVAGAACCALPLLAACDGGAEEPSDASPSAEASVGDVGETTATSGGALKLHLAAFDSLVAFEGLAVPAGQFSPVDSAEGFYGSATSVVEPASCTAFHQAAELGSDADLGAAAQDLINPVGPFFVDGVPPEDEEDLTVASVLTRVFGDPELASTVPAALLESECTAYTVTSSWDGTTAADERVITAVDQLDLPGLAAPIVRVRHGAEESVFYGPDGEVEHRSTYEPRTAYVHVAGPYAISVEVVGVEDEEAQAARVIQAYVDHMGAA